TCRRITRLGRRILRSTLRLQPLGMENPVFAKAAFRERLRVVLERVWWWLCTCIAHRQTQVLLHQNEIHMRAAALNRARLHITRHAKPLGVSTVTKPPQLFDRDVIALALLHPA